MYELEPTANILWRLLPITCLPAAAVVAGNFGTTLLAAASQLLVHAGVPSADAPQILAPLALASIEQASRPGS